MGKAESGVLMLGLVVVVIICEAAAYDYFQMVEQWQPATCSDKKLRFGCRQKPKQVFTIHGSWPSNYSRARSKPCRGSRFDITKIAPIRAQLNQYWPDVVNGNHQRFWEHEWSKHGTCSEKQFPGRAYFQNALNIAKRHDLLSILKKAGHNPDGKVKQRASIEAAITKAIGKRPVLRCNFNKSNARQLHEIVLCVAKNGVALESCTKFAAATCPNTFVWG
ncbi:ribonuclease MC-like [Momordica charantia]|uniref:Ribonuclease MC-like n=1 Tax=Momordica charantia TaxID=3673 RepID=A0A6J1DXG5_MOMCH|nr:ribonuclease MC-like [Momordica charantia]